MANANELPAELAELRDQMETAEGNLAMAEAAESAAHAELDAAQDKARAAGDALSHASAAFEWSRQGYLAALRRHGYVQTADGPRPAAEVPA